MADHEYFVAVLAGRWDNEIAGAIERAGMRNTGGHSSHGTVEEGGLLPDNDVHTLAVSADDENTAREKVKAALDSISRPHTIERVEPSG